MLDPFVCPKEMAGWFERIGVSNGTPVFFLNCGFGHFLSLLFVLFFLTGISGDVGIFS